MSLDLSDLAVNFSEYASALKDIIVQLVLVLLTGIAATRLLGMEFGRRHGRTKSESIIQKPAAPIPTVPVTFTVLVQVEVTDDKSRLRTTTLPVDAGGNEVKVQARADVRSG